MENKKIDEDKDLDDDEKISAMIEETIAKKMNDKTPEEQNKFRELLTKIYVDGVTPREAMGLTDAMVNSLYNRAYKFYESGKYQDAEDIFHLLFSLDEYEPKFVIGLAACHHMQKKYNEAITAYLLASALDMNNPIPFYQLADCYIQLKDPYKALVALEVACIRAESNPAYEPIKERARMLIDGLNEQQKNENLKNAETA